MSRAIKMTLSLKLAVLLVCLSAPAAGQDAAPDGKRAADQQEQLLQEALAGQEEAGDSRVEAPDMSYTATVMLFGAGVLALAGWGVRRFYNGKQQGVSSDIDVIDTVSLEGGDKLTLVEVNGRRVLVGRSSAGMSALDAWPAARQTPAVAPERAAPRGVEASPTDKADAVDAFFQSAPAEFEQEFRRARQAAQSPAEVAGRDGSRERDSVLVSLRALEKKHGGQS